MATQDSLTIIYYTANRIPQKFMFAVQRQLAKAADGIPIISVSQHPLDFGRLNICLGDIGQNTWNIYYQLLKGAERAETDYVATAEDDILYSRSHYHTRLSSDGKFLYDLNRWSVYTWKRPEFDYREGRLLLSQLICERDLLVGALQERFAKYPTPDSIDIRYFGEPGRHEAHLGVTPHEVETFSSDSPSVMFNHEASINYRFVNGRRKVSGTRRARQLPPWGYADEVLALYE